MAAVTDEEKVEEECIERSEIDESSSSQKRSKHSKNHKHKHSRKHKHKHKKHKHKIRSSSRSGSKSTSRSRSRSQSDDNSDDDSKFEASLIMNSEDFTSFKLTKSVSRSRSSSPSSKKVPERANTKRMSKSPPFCSEGNLENQRKKSRSKSKSPPFYTAADIESREKILARGNSKSPPLYTGGADLEGKTQEHFESKFKSTFCPPDEPKNEAYLELKNGSTSPPPDSAILTNNDNLNSQCTTENTQESTTNSKESEPKQSRSKSPNTTGNHRTRTKSSSRSVSPKQRKAKRSHSKSRSRSPRKKHGKKSRSRSSSSDKKRSRKRSKSRSLSSRSRSRSPKKSSQSHRSRSRDRRNRSPVQRGRSRRSPSPRRRYGNSSFDRRRTRLNRSSRRSPSPKHSYSKRSRSRTPHGRYRRKSSRSVSPRRGRSRSPRSKKYSRRSQSKSRSRRSRSRSYSRKQRLSKSRSRSRSKSRDRSKRRSRSKSADTISEKKSTATTIEKGASSLTTNVATAKDLVGKAPTVSDPSNKRSLAQLTEFCKKLTEARGISEALRRQVNDNGDKIKEEDDPAPSISHPFLVAPKKDITIPQVIFPVKPILPPMNMVDSSKPLTEQFPVSCGTQHHEKEREESTSEVIVNIDGAAATAQPVFHQPQIQQKLDISGLVVKRLDAQRRLQINPSDIDAMLALQEIEMKLNNWCQSNVKPGQYTGQLVKQMMPKEKMNTGYQAWARKDMFQNLNPVSGGIGMKLLQKMGWEPGQVLGKRGEGIAEPIALPVKVDRKGLSSNTEKPVGKKAAGKAVTMDLQGKHPISLLQEYCARRKWQVPEFALIFDEGPPHSKQFLFKVAVNGYEYQHPVVSGNKKHAKAQAAVAALKGLALIPEDTEF